METMDFYRKTPQPAKLSDFRRGLIRLKYNGNQKEMIRMFAYCLMPNHFHLLIQQLVEGGVTNFLRNIKNSYTRYFNTKYDRIGPLFQGTFKAKLVNSDEYLLQLSKYIHRNPDSLLQWKNKIYPYSSYRYYLSSEKSSFCDPDFILSYFSSANPKLSYKSFVEEKSFVDDARVSSLYIEEE